MKNLKILMTFFINKMNIIVDTHIFLWLLNDPSKVKNNYLKLLKNLENTIFLSVISIAELMIKSSIGKIEINFNIIEYAKKMGFELLDFTANDAILLKSLPFYHKDPFDRMIICQALANNYYIITDDENFKNYKCKLV